MTRNVFLMDWISDSYDNVAGYESSAYDTLMSIIARASDGHSPYGAASMMRRLCCWRIMC